MAGRPKGTPKTGGRKRGTPNKLTTDVKEAVMKAFDAVGGEEYLVMVAREQPQVFCSLLGKILPSQMKVSGDENAPINLKTVVELVRAQG